MIELIVATLTAFWLGVLTSISPCPLATNIAAVSYVSKRVGEPHNVFLAGLLYTLGRTLTYLVLGIVLVYSLLSAPSLSFVLQKYMNMVLGPLLILVGMVLLELITFNIGSGGISEKMRQRVEQSGIWGAGLLGILFALSFCPTSAALFFGSLLPLAVQQQSGVLLPASYGLATGLPVLLFAVCIALGANWVARVYGKVVAFEKYARYVTGTIFILVGIYYTLAHAFGISLT